LDEGHKVKTHGARVSQAARALPAKWRLLLTGTPVQVLLQAASMPTRAPSMPQRNTHRLHSL
jgi:SNF2 family DNA or RNA helicase